MLTQAQQEAFIASCRQHLEAVLHYDAKHQPTLEAAYYQQLAAFLAEVKHNLLNIQEPQSQQLYLEDMLSEMSALSDLMAPSDGDILFPYMLRKTLPSVLIDEAEEDDLLMHEGGKQQALYNRLWRLRKIKELDPDLRIMSKQLHARDWLAYQVELGSQVLQTAWNQVAVPYAQRGGFAGATPDEYRHRKPAVAPVLADLKAYVPWVMVWSKSYYRTEAHALDEWVYYLGGISWRNYPYTTSWPAPQEYEQALFTTPDRSAFIAGLKRLLAAAAPWLALKDDDEECWLLRETVTDSSQGVPRAITLQRARVSAQRMAAWLLLRERPIATQMLDALQRVVIIPAWNAFGEPTQAATIALPDKDQEQTQCTPQFQLLLEEFRQHLPSTDAAWKLLRSQLTHLSQFPLAALKKAQEQCRTNSFQLAELARQLPLLRFVDLTGTTHQLTEVAPDFWLNLEQVVQQRMVWAQQAYEAIAEPTSEYRLLDTAMDDESDKKLSQRQVALLYLCQNQPAIKSYNANEIAKSFGYKSGQRLIDFYKLMKDRLRTLDVEGREIKPFIRDIKAVLPHLNPQQRQRAEKHLAVLQAKIS